MCFFYVSVFSVLCVLKVSIFVKLYLLVRPFLFVLCFWRYSNFTWAITLHEIYVSVLVYICYIRFLPLGGGGGVGGRGGYSFSALLLAWLLMVLLFFVVILADMDSSVKNKWKLVWDLLWHKWNGVQGKKGIKGMIKTPRPLGRMNLLVDKPITPLSPYAFKSHMATVSPALRMWDMADNTDDAA